jgi:AAA+ ATPase superfamily predicted ATPase
MNPFLIDHYVTPEFFCDRINETQTIIDNISNRKHIAFFAQRRVGKTALIQHVFYLLKRKKTECIYLDIYATQNLKDFTNELANSIYQAFPTQKSMGKKFW